MTGKHRAKAEKAEEDVESDSNVAGSRASRNGDGETGAVARSQDG